ncbi:MAG TPA: hypothetical protein VE569_13295, partial [Acidimicrobiia bacterium]|nr:hypothetical protein [Acidimicrobiia bacterium]
EPSNVLIDIEDGRFRVSSGRLQLGSWALTRIRAERSSIYRFTLDIDNEKFDFYPDDPSNFSDAVGAIVDLTESGGRFGLRQRIEEAMQDRRH